MPSSQLAAPNGSPIAPFTGLVAANGFFLLTVPISLVALSALLVIQYSFDFTTWHSLYPVVLGPLTSVFFAVSEYGIAANLLLFSIPIAAILSLSRGTYYRASAQQS